MPLSQVPLRYAHNEGHTDVCFSEDGQKYITCGSDGDMRIWSQDLYEDPIHNCVGEWALAIRQKGAKLYIATSNNDVQIITFPDGDRDGILDRYVAPINDIAISKSGDMIALAAEEMEVKLIRLNGEEKKKSNLTGFQGPVLSVSLCPKLKFVAASGGDGRLCIWNIENETLVKEINCVPKVNSLANAKILCKIEFEPKKGTQLAFPDGTSVIILKTSDWSKLITLSCGDVQESYSIVRYSPCGEYLAASSLAGDIVIWRLSDESVHNVTKHPNGTRICALTWNPSGTNQIAYTDIEGQLGILNDCITKKEPNEDVQQQKESVDEEKGSDVDFDNYQFENDDDDENVISIEKLKKQYANDEDPDLKSIASRTSTPRPRTPVIPLQEAFMPSSTPVHLDPRYLCWNEVGIVRCYGSVLDEDETSSKSIEVDFHDSTFHNSMILQNFQNYTMGYLSRSVLSVANASQINVIPLSSRTKEWTLTMNDNEEIVAIAASEQLVCIGLSNYIIRVCSSYGTQRAIFSVPGPIVCLAAHKEDILIAYHSGAVRDGDQCINFKLIRLERMNCQGQELSSALGPKCNLSWLGFTDCGTPSVMDSSGMLHLYPLSCNTWIPFCDTSKHTKGMVDTFFVTCVLETNQTLCGIRCRGAVFPAIIPRPTMCEIPLEAPFAEMSTDKSQMESSLFTWSTLLIPNTEKKIKETALKTFALSCKNNLDQRAQELMEILGNPQILNLAIKYASRLDKKRFATTLTELMSKLNEEGGDEVEEATEAIEVRPPVIRKLNTSTKQSSKKITPEEVPIQSDAIQKLENDSFIVNSINSSIDDSIVSQDLFTAEKPRNPFLKNLQNKPRVSGENPLKLLDSNAGLNFDVNNKKREENVEKRKQRESENDNNQKSKQRKLDRFMFGKS